jgi:hypothetical protein
MAVYDYTPLYGGGDIIPGTTARIFENLGLENPNVPVFRLLGSENKGGNNVNESMNFAAIPGQSYRLVNNATGEVLGEASTTEGISALVEQSNALSKRLGKKADLSFEQSQPDVLGGGYSPIFQDQPNELVGGFLGNVMDVALPTLASLVVPGAGLFGTILPAAGASAVSSLMQERGLQETLLRAALTGAGSGLGEKFLAPAIDSALRPATQAASQAGTQAVTQAGTQAVTQSAAGQAGDILVNALPSLLSRGLSTGITSLATNLLPSAFDSAQLDNIAPEQTTTVDQTYTPPPENLIVTATQPNVTGIFPAVTGGISNTLLDQVVNQPPAAPPAEPTVTSDEIVVTAQNQPNLNLGGLLNIAPSQINPPVTTPPAAPPAEPTVTDDEIVVTARPTTPVVPPFVPPIVVPPGILPPATTPTTPTTPAEPKPPADKKDVLGTGLTLPELLAIGGVGVDLLGSLLGGGGGTGTATPYVSPFGTGAGLGTGRDMRVNPNIADYERYGFGPEAMFFRPEYSQILAAPAAQAQPAAITNPVYTPLI